MRLRSLLVVASATGPRPGFAPRAGLAILAVASLLVSACGATLPREAGAPEPGRLTVVTYNIRAGADVERQPNLERVAALLDSLNADIAFLQEVDRGTRRSGGVDQVAELERLTGMSGTFGRAIDYDGGEYGVAVLTRLPIREHEVIPLTPPVREGERPPESRVALYLLLEPAAGPPLSVFSTHLNHGEGTYRRQEMVALLAAIHRRAGADGPLVVGGDLNARPETDELTAVTLVLDDAWLRCGDGPGMTFPAHAPDRRIDYILLRGVECTSARVPASTASDHLPVAVRLVWPPR